MAIIIGAGTTVVSSQFPNGGIASINFGFQPQINRLFQLGSFSPYDVSIQKNRTLQLTVYGKKASGSGGSVQLDVLPSTSCVDAGTVQITINPASCAGGLLPFVDDYFCNSYGYSKDNQGFGQESWGFTTKPIIPGYSGTIVMLRGIAEGTIATGDGTMTGEEVGVVINESASNDSLGAPVEGESGGVQAGSPGVGNFDITRSIIVTAVGGSLGSDSTIDGRKGETSVQIPLTPVFI